MHRKILLACFSVTIFLCLENSYAACLYSSFVVHKGNSDLVLIGSMHMGTIDVSKAMQSLAGESINRATVLYTESGLPMGEVPKAQQEAVMNSRNYIDYLKDNPSLYDSWKINLKLNYGFSDNEISRIRVADFIGIILAKYTKPEVFGEVVASLKSEYGVEHILMDAARKQGAEVAAIEDIPPQIFFNQLTSKQVEEYSQIAFDRLVEMSKSKGRHDYPVINVDQILKMTISGDVDTIADTSESVELSAVKDTQNLILANSLRSRNSVIANRIDEVVKSNSNKRKLVVAVGAAHLGGKYGVISALRERGYSFSCYFN